MAINLPWNIENLPLGSQIVDSKTKNVDYNLILVGRKLSKEDQLDTETKHFLNKEIFHEDGDTKTDEGILKDEGVLSYYSRNFGKVILLLWAIAWIGGMYQFSMGLSESYEDYLDYVLYQNLKRKRNMDWIIRITYLTNASNADR